MPDDLSPISTPNDPEVPAELRSLAQELAQDGARWRAGLHLSTAHLEQHLRTLPATRHPEEHQPMPTIRRVPVQITIAATVIVALLIALLVHYHAHPASTPPQKTSTPLAGMLYHLTAPCPSADATANTCQADAQLAQSILLARETEVLGMALPSATVTATKALPPTLQAQLVLPGSVTIAQIESVLLPQGQMHIIDTSGQALDVGTRVAADHYPALFSNNDIEPKSVVLAQSQGGFQQIAFAMRAGDSQQRFAQYTSQHIGSYLTVTLDDLVIESAVIQSQITGAAYLSTPTLSAGQARIIATFIRYPPLPSVFQLDGVPGPATPTPSPTAAPTIGTMSLLVGNKIWQTQNGGATWGLVPEPTETPINPSYLIYTHLGVQMHWLAWTDIAPDAQSATITIAQTTDGGHTWHLTKLASSNDLKTASTIQFIDPLHGWVGWIQGTGAGGMYRTLDGGTTWTLFNGPVLDGPSLGSMTFITPSLGFFVGGFRTTSNRFGVTHDGGRTWTRIILDPHPAQDQQLNPFYLLPKMLDAQHGITIVVYENNFSVYATNDGGAQWVLVKTITATAGNMPYPLIATFGQQIWMYLQPNLLYRSVDGGLTWTAQALAESRITVQSQIQFFSDSIGLILLAPLNCVGIECAPRTVLRTNDGGLSWQTIGSIG